MRCKYCGLEIEKHKSSFDFKYRHLISKRLYCVDANSRHLEGMEKHATPDKESTIIELLKEIDEL